MTSFSQGAVVLVQFVYPDQTGVKLRPALVLSTDTYHRGRQEVILAGITSNIHRMLVGDTVVQDWQAAGLLAPSVVTGILQTVKQSTLSRSLGSLSARDLRTVEANIRVAIGFR
ncbi:MAG: type II toxin-antitoxin system PemK/MazF family toxin [Chloroflexi bacterium]|nr:type II toxin-antitoxin system PemK/MazF family toxin [Chloroflexota bacterium]